MATKDFLEKERIIGREFYDFYRENRKQTAKEIGKYMCFVKAVGGVLTLIKKEMYEREFGVYIEGFGHLCYIRDKKASKNTLEKSPLKKSKKFYKWRHWFIPENDSLKDWYYLTDERKKPLIKHTIDLQAIQLSLEIEKHNRRLSRESKDIKFITN